MFAILTCLHSQLVLGDADGADADADDAGPVSPISNHHSAALKDTENQILLNPLTRLHYASI